MRILFVGNSFTARNNLPGLLATLAAERGITVEHRLISAGGASLRQHLNAGKALTELATGNYDTVVLQEQSTLPAKNPARMHENIRDFHTAITEAGAQTALYMTWSRKGTPQQPITTAYATIAAELAATLIPAGLIWQHFQTTNPTPALHAPDNTHPALAGTYLTACVFLISLLHEDPTSIDLPVKGLDDDTATLLRQSAWTICETLTKPRAATFTLVQVDEIHDRLGSASTLAAYLEALREIGVTTSDSYLTDGHTTYHGNAGHQISTPAAHQVFPIAPTSNKPALLEALKLHQEQTISYVEMSRTLADAGIEKWTFDTHALTISYYDRTGSALLTEQVS